MGGASRYGRLFLAFARFGLASELAFRANFLVKLVVETLWFAILLFFYERIFLNTKQVAGWGFEEYLFFVGCHFALGGVVETFFLSNCMEFPEMVRSGDLDTYLLKPIDEQFLITSRTMDWSTLPNIFMGVGVMGFALVRLHWGVDVDWTMSLLRGASFLVLFACGVALMYSFLLLLTSSSVWFVRNQSLMELWWLFTTLMRYPRQIFTGTWASPFGWFFTFILPVLLVVSVPASTMVKAFEPWFIAVTVGATVVLLVVSRRFFRYALQSYRSASS